MSVRVLSADLARELLSRHPEISVENIPTYGLRVVDDFEGDTRDYLIGIVSDTGEIKVMDVTARDDFGGRIDPEHTWLPDFSDLWRDVTGGVGSGLRTFLDNVIGPNLFYVALVVGAIWLVNKSKGKSPAESAG